MRSWEDGLAPHGLLAGQVLLAPLDFVHRQQYLHARATLTQLLALGVVPVVNENDAVPMRRSASVTTTGSRRWWPTSCEPTCSCC